MARQKMTAAEYIESQTLVVPGILGDLIEHLGTALQSWSSAVQAARRGDLDRALTEVVDVEIAVDILKVGRSEIRALMDRAGKLLDLELPEEDETPSSMGDIRER